MFQRKARSGMLLLVLVSLTLTGCTAGFGQVGESDISNTPDAAGVEDTYSRYKTALETRDTATICALVTESFMHKLGVQQRSDRESCPETFSEIARIESRKFEGTHLRKVELGNGGASGIADRDYYGQKTETMFFMVRRDDRWVIADDRELRLEGDPAIPKAFLDYTTAIGSGDTGRACAMSTEAARRVYSDGSIADCAARSERYTRQVANLPAPEVTGVTQEGDSAAITVVQRTGSTRYISRLVKLKRVKGQWLIDVGWTYRRPAPGSSDDS